MIAISPRLRTNTVGATTMQRGGLCSTGVQENSSMQPVRIQVGWSVLVQLCFLDLGTGVPILRGDLTSGLKGKRTNRLLRATGSLFLLLYCVSPAKAAGGQPNRCFLPTKSRTKSYRAVAEPARRIARLANSSAPAAVATARRRAKSSNKFTRCLVYSTAGCSLTASFSTATAQPWCSI